MRITRVLLFVCSLLAALPCWGEDVVFAGYNLRNYLRSEKPERSERSEPRGKRPMKSEKEITGIVETLRQIKPDILGICEVGSQDDLKDFQKRLSKAGLNYQETEWVEGDDPERHVALLSRFPIVGRQSVTDAAYDLGGKRHRVLRGFLDVTVELSPSYKLRLVGVHLKSRRPSEDGEAIIRRNEAHLLRKHLVKILADDPSTNLLCYGDFNDSKNTPVIQEIAGRRGAPDEMKDIWLRDPLGDRWTYYNSFSDTYERIDYVFVNRALWPEVERDKSMVFRTNDWYDASDHRPIVVTVDPKNR